MQIVYVNFTALAFFFTHLLIKYCTWATAFLWHYILVHHTVGTVVCFMAII